MSGWVSGSAGGFRRPGRRCTTRPRLQARTRGGVGSRASVSGPRILIIRCSQNRVTSMGWRWGRRLRPMPLTLQFCIYCGADPLVRAGPPGPAFANRISIRPEERKPTRASAADRGVRPTAKVSGIGRLRVRGTSTSRPMACLETRRRAGILPHPNLVCHFNLRDSVGSLLGFRAGHLADSRVTGDHQFASA